MRAIIPLAGSATRLRPITNHKPKALVEVAGKPVIEHIMLNLAQNGINDLILIVGHEKEKLMKWLVKEFSHRFILHFVEQGKPLGLGHAVYCAKDYMDDEEILVMLGDEIFSKNYSKMIEDCKKSNEINAAVGTMMVRDPTHYGMLEVGEDGYVTLMVEKPKEFRGNLALAGAYYFKHGRDLRNALEELIESQSSEQEYQLTDALQLMVGKGSKIVTFAVGEGYDCGRPRSLLLSNRRMLHGKHFIHESAIIGNSEIVEPCYIQENVRIKDSLIGPYVSIGRNSEIESCTLSDTIIETGTAVVDKQLSYCIISGTSMIRLSEEDSQVVSNSAMEMSTRPQSPQEQNQE